MTYIVGGLYLIALTGLVFFWIHRFKIIWACGWHRDLNRSRDRVKCGVGETRKLCIQCPVYNEPLVVVGLLETVAALEWIPRHLEIQILDDSTDETSRIIARWMRDNPERAADMRHLRRNHRGGYKAGALAYGMTHSEASFFAILDADFRPRPDFLPALMTAFGDPEVGLVQARWTFSNRRSSFLTRLQALFLDAHFLVEQVARAESNLFFNFNGTAGIWRRTALEKAGGWSADTVTEDLDISYRAQMAGWRFVYLADYTVPSELPEELIAFKSQQQRWTKGGIQVMRKLLGALLKSKVSWRIKLEGFFHLTLGFIHFFLVLFALVFVPFLILFGPVPHGLFWFVHPVVLLGAGGSALLFYLGGQFLRDAKWSELGVVLMAAPLILSFGLAMGVTGSWAVVEGLFSHGGEFIRTPKGRRVGGSSGGPVPSRIGAPVWILAGIETMIATVFVGGAIYFLHQSLPLVALMLGVKAVGYLGLVGWFLHESWLAMKRSDRLEVLPVLDS